MSDAGTKRPSSLPFIPAKLDDYGLPATVFRVYCHIARRAGENGECFEAVPAMAEAVKIHPQTIRTALKLLVGQGMLTEERRAGQTSIYRLSPVSKWQPYRNGYPTETDIDKGTPLKLPPEGTPKVDLQFPLNLSGPAFAAAWKEWTVYYTGKVPKAKRGSLTLTYQKQLNRLADMSEAQAVEAINHSIGSSYQSIYPPRQFQPNKPAVKPQSERDYTEPWK